jgi:hypothetical protein
MPSAFDTLWQAGPSAVMGTFFGEPVEYTDLAGVPVTDSLCYVDFIESGYEVDAGIRTSQDERNNRQQGIDYQNRRTFGFRKSVIGEDKPAIYATVRVVSGGAKADVWTVWRVIGGECDRWYIECERVEKHEKSRPGMRTKG